MWIRVRVRVRVSALCGLGLVLGLGLGLVLYVDCPTVAFWGLSFVRYFGHRGLRHFTITLRTLHITHYIFFP